MIQPDIVIDNILTSPQSTSADTIDLNNIVNQVFEDPTEKIVDFAPIQLWQIGEENTIEYTLPMGYEEAENDWIGVYKVYLLNNSGKQSFFKFNIYFCRKILADLMIILRMNIQYAAKHLVVMWHQIK